MLKKLVVFFSIVIFIITMNSTYHSHIDDHHDHYHMAVDAHEIVAEDATLHYSEHTQYQENIGVMASILLLLVLFTKISPFLLLSLKNKVIQLVSITTFYRHIFIDPPPIITRYILFHAPPQHHS